MLHNELKFIQCRNQYSVFSPCPPPFKLRWNTRESGRVNCGQTIATCEKDGVRLRVTSQFTGRLIDPIYRSNTTVEGVSHHVLNQISPEMANNNDINRYVLSNRHT